MTPLSPQGTALSISNTTGSNVSDADIGGRYPKSSKFASDQTLQMTPQKASIALLPGDDERRSSSVSSLGGQLLGYEYQQSTHLPTPQSAKYAHRDDASRFSPESPLVNKLQQAQPVQLSRRPAFAHEGDKSRTPQIMTPDSSPPPVPVTPPPSSPLMEPPDQTPKQDSSRLPRIDANATPLGPPANIPSPRSTHSGRSAGQSQLSSPFMEKLSIAGRSQRSVSPPMLALDQDDGFTASVADLSKAAPERLQALRMKYIGGQSLPESEAEIEARRPDYLKRGERLLNGTVSLDDLTSMSTSERLGIKDSPIKGRRIQLFQETSEESFEESLMAGGYPRYGSSPAYDVPHTPGKDRSSQLSEHTLAWLQQATPGPSKVSEPETPVDERAMKKRKRLAAFQNASAASDLPLPPPRKLVPVYIEGKGRVLMDAALEDDVLDDDTPSKRKKNRRRKPAAASVAFPTLAKQNLMATIGPNWPDAQFPWCVRHQERAELARAEEEERLRRISEFFDRDSGDEEGDEDDELSSPVEWGYDHPPKPPRMGRGKMVTPRADPGARRPVNGNVYLPSGPADAKAALLSKKVARRLRYRLQHPDSEDDDADTITCICRGRNDGEQAVQCDKCDGWYHLSCVGLSTIADLGPEDTMWYCPKCTSAREHEGSPSQDSMASSEPTMASDDRFAPRTPRDPLYFDPSVQESPMVRWRQDPPPSTPDGPSLSTPLRNLFSTPTFNFQSSSPAKDGFDPTSTPSRGVGLSRYGFFSTPGQGVFGSGLSGNALGGRLSFSQEPFSTPVRARIPSNPDESPVRRRSDGGAKEQTDLIGR